MTSRSMLLSIVVILMSISSVFAQHIVVEPEAMDFGEVIIGERAGRTLSVSNDGNADLIVERVDIDGNVFVTDFRDEVIIQANRSINIAVMFTPGEASEFNGTLTISSNDEDNPELEVPITGTGVERQQDDMHFHFTRTDANHSILVLAATLMGEPLPEGDEIGVFTPVGICCGAGVWTGDRVGVAAWADEERTEAIEGMLTGEEMSFRIWDWETEAEYRGIPTFIQGNAIFAVNGMTVIEIAGAELNHWEAPEATDNNHSLLVTGATLDEEPLVTDDEIAVFTQEGLLAGWAIWPEEGRIGFPAWGDEAQTEDVIEGFVANEPFTFMVWDHLADEEWLAEAHFSRGSEVYAPNGFSVLELEAYRYRDLVVNLRQGWNMNSINVSPLSLFYEDDEDRGPDIILMMAELVDEGVLEIMKDGSGQFYSPEFDYNGIPYWNLVEGYLIKVTEASTVTWTGLPIPPDTDVPLQESWNTITYFPTYELPCDAPDFVAFSPIIELVEIAKDGQGNFAAPEYNYSNMPPWRETQGYMVKVSEEVVLNYPLENDEENTAREGNVNDEPVNNHWADLTVTDHNISVLVNSISGLQPNRDNQIAAFSPNGLLVGVGRIDADGRAGLAVWGDDSSTKEIDGLMSHEAFELKIWVASQEIEQPLTNTPLLKGQGLYFSTNDFIVLDGMVEKILPAEYYLAQNYPNPFNAVTRISYGLLERCSVSICVYDVSGRVIETLINDELDAGHYNASWDGKSSAAGVYFIRMETPANSSTIKTLLLK